MNDPILSTLTHRDSIMALPENERLDAALSLIDSLTGDDLVSVNYFMTEYKLTTTEARIASMLNDRAGALVAKRVIHDGLYSMSNDDAADIKIVDVLICKMRKKIPDWIETVWGAGYRANKRIDIPAPKTELREVTMSASAIRRESRWTSRDNRILRTMAGQGKDVVEIAAVLGRTQRAIIERAISLGIKYVNSKKGIMA